MTQELADKLIKWYEDTISMLRVQSDPWQLTNILVARYVEKGVCWCAKSVFDADLYQDDWVEAHTDITTGHWADIPSGFSSLGSVIGALQVRIDILRTFKTK